MQFLLSTGILLVLGRVSFWGEDWALGLIPWRFGIILNFPKFRRSKVVSRSTTHQVTLIYQFIKNDQASFHLWWKVNLVKYHKFSKYCNHGCTSIYFFKIFFWWVNLWLNSRSVLAYCIWRNIANTKYLAKYFIAQSTVYCKQRSSLF